MEHLLTATNPPKFFDRFVMIKIFSDIDIIYKFNLFKIFDNELSNFL